MNVKAGDMARVVAPYHINGRGAIVNVLHPTVTNPQQVSGNLYWDCLDSPCWVCSGWVKNALPEVLGPLCIIADKCLQPLSPEEMETQQQLMESVL